MSVEGWVLAGDGATDDELKVGILALVEMAISDGMYGSAEEALREGKPPFGTPRYFKATIEVGLVKQFPCQQVDCEKPAQWVCGTWCFCDDCVEQYLFLLPGETVANVDEELLQARLLGGSAFGTAYRASQELLLEWEART